MKTSLFNKKIKLKSKAFSSSVNKYHLRPSKLKYVADSLLEDKNDSHLNEEVCKTTARVALKHNGHMTSATHRYL